MIKNLFVFIAAFGLCFASDTPQPPSPSIRIAVENTGGLQELLPDLEGDAPPAGNRGCLAGGTQCAEGDQIRGAAAAVMPGSPMRVGIAGEGTATRIAIVFQGEEILVRENEQLPAHFAIPTVGAPGRLHVSVEMEGTVTEKSVLVGEAPAKPAFHRDTTSSPSIRFFVNVAEEGNWEVITGSGTGGRLVPTRTYCMIPGLTVDRCPIQYRVFGYTDRARRGEQVWTLVQGAGVASRLGVIISGRVRGQWLNVGLPVLIPQTVSLDPNADNVYAFGVLNNVYFERRLPIGTRPF